MKKINIAIDGYAGCGKSTTAKAVARNLNYTYIDTGAMYRAVSLYLLRAHVPFEEESPALAAALGQIALDFIHLPDCSREITLNGERVEPEIRKPEVSDVVSQVSKHRSVRAALVREQQRMAQQGGVVMDGRDIGTVVLPGAELKVFMTANIDVRTSRRQAELREKGIEQAPEEIRRNLLERDRIDTSRTESPLRQAEDAILIDTTHIEIPEQVRLVCELAHERMDKS
jgi:cytidylate kinase